MTSSLTVEETRNLKKLLERAAVGVTVGVTHTRTKSSLGSMYNVGVNMGMPMDANGCRRSRFDEEGK